MRFWPRSSSEAIALILRQAEPLGIGAAIALLFITAAEPLARWWLA